MFFADSFSNFFVIVNIKYKFCWKHVRMKREMETILYKERANVQSSLRKICLK